MKVKFKYKFESILDCDLNTYQKIVNASHKHQDNFFDLLGEVVGIITTLDRDTIDIIPIAQLKEIYDKGIFFDEKETEKLTTEFNGFKAFGEPKTYDDIEFNRLQYRIIKEGIDNDELVKTIASVVFIDELADLKNKPLLQQRQRKFGKEMPLRVLLPYLTKYLHTNLELTKEQIDIFTQLGKS